MCPLVRPCFGESDGDYTLFGATVDWPEVEVSLSEGAPNTVLAALPVLCRSCPTAQSASYDGSVAFRRSRAGPSGLARPCHWEAPRDENASEEPRQTVEEHNRHRTILVVDDERAIRDLLRLQLEDAGYRVVLAESAHRAAELVRDEKPDLMIVDAHMPFVSGLDFVSTLIADSSMPWAPVIFMTGRPELRVHAQPLGAACLVKPFLAPRLIELVQRVLRSQERLYAAAGLGGNQVLNAA